MKLNIGFQKWWTSCGYGHTSSPKSQVHKCAVTKHLWISRLKLLQPKEWKLGFCKQVPYEIA
jgi:hypothetical protein